MPSKSKRTGPKKPQISKKVSLNDEEKLIHLAEIAWTKALEEYYFPPLSKPVFKFNYTHNEGFYIDPYDQWQVTMNLAQAPLFARDEDYIRYFSLLAMHEIGYYDLIPYDGLTNARLLAAAMKSVPNHFAPIVVNVFSDLIIDTTLYRKHPIDMLWENRHTFEVILNKKKKIIPFLEMLFRCYEILWNEKIAGEYDFSEVETVAQKITKIVNTNFEDESKWEEKTKKIGRLLKLFLNDTFTLIGPGSGKCPKGKERRRSEGGRTVVEMPEEIIDVLGNPLENRNIDKIKKDNEEENRRKAEEFAKDRSFNDYGSPAVQAGLLKDGEALNSWYRGLAKDLISIKMYEEKPSGQMPAYPETWRIGDPLEQLDAVQTLLSFPKIIPNITTKKWNYEEGPGILEEKELPDLMIVLDSSGSMNWMYRKKISPNSKTPYHVALVAAFAVLHYIARKGCKFSVINFAGRADVLDWTFDYIKAEKRLLKWQGSGTILPIRHMIKLAEKSERKLLIIVITDFGLYNWRPAKKGMIELLKKGHKIVAFFINSFETKIDDDERFKDLYDKGAIFYQIKNVKDMVDLVIKEVKKNYS